MLPAEPCGAPSRRPQQPQDPDGEVVDLEDVKETVSAAYRRFKADIEDHVHDARQRGAKLLHDAEDLTQKTLSKRWVCETLISTPASVAVLLPDQHSPFEGGHRLPCRIRAAACVDTTFQGQPCRLWVMDFDDRGTGEPVPVQMRYLRYKLEAATSHCKLANGPWIWPLHDNALSLAILSATVALRRHEVPRWRHFLWALRIFPLPGGAQTTVWIHKHYGCAVAYCFAWANWYVRGLWVLLAATLLLACFGSLGPGDVGSGSGRWHALQLLTLLWARVVADLGSSKKFILEQGGEFSDASSCMLKSSITGMLSEVTEAADAATDAVADSAASLGTRVMGMASSVVSQAMKTQERIGTFTREGLKRDRATAIERELTRRSRAAPSPPPAAPISPEAQERRARALARWKKALASASMVAQRKVLSQQRNTAHVELSERQRRLRRCSATVLEVCTLSIFVVFAILILGGFVQLNMYIAFIWGRCIEPEIREMVKARGELCRDPEVVHGFVGWLAEVSSDILLAILFDVLLAAAAKALARALCRYRNFYYESQRLHHELMLSLIVEAMSKVGMFSLIGFLFLPRWAGAAVTTGGTDFDAARQCGFLPDFQVCSAVFGAETCASTLLCIAQRLDFADRSTLFIKSVKGPFVVAPFIRILVTVIIPWVAARLEEAVTDDERGGFLCVPQCCGRCCKGFYSCFSPIARILGLIFAYDGDGIGGCGFIVKGWPYGKLVPLSLSHGFIRCANYIIGGRDKAIKVGLKRCQSALLQVARKEFEPLDECLEQKMSFLFVTFFIPIMPFGLLPTVIARCLEVRFKNTKLFFVRRRCWPAAAETLHRTQEAFTQAAILLASAWQVGLVLVAYNPDVSSMSVIAVLGVWFAATAGVIVGIYLLGRLVQAVMLSVIPWVEHLLGARCRCKDAGCSDLPAAATAAAASAPAAAVQDRRP